MSPKDKLLTNIAAIEAMFALEKGEPQTDERRQKLKSYLGFGELKCILLDPKQPDQFTDSEKNLIPYVDQLHKVLFFNSKSDREFNMYLDSLKSSVLTAFYTPKELVSAINDALSSNKISFQNILEPSAGSGVFLANIKGEKFTAIEKDLLTGKILKHLNPDKEVRIGGFEETPKSFNEKFNLVISNIPFGDFKVFDPDLMRQKDSERARACNTIHTYFFEKGLDMIKDGGILAFITSTGVMDARRNELFRKHLLSRSNLISAIRLPQNTFEGTKVQSDLIVLQKNSHKRELSARENQFIKLTESELVPGYFFNSLYDDDRRIIYTKAWADTNLYGKPAMLYEHHDGINGIVDDVRKLLSKDLSINFDRSLINIQSEKATAPLQLSFFDQFAEFANIEVKAPKQKGIQKTGIAVPIVPKTFRYENAIFNQTGSFQKSGNLIGIATSERMADVIHFEPQTAEIVKSYIDLRDCYLRLKEYENSKLTEAPELRENLNLVYDTFSAKYGHFTDLSGILVSDVSFAEIKGLEILTNGQIKKADIFREPVAFSIIKSKLTPEEALSVSLNKFNKVNIDFICSLTELKEFEVLEKLEDKIFLNPETYQYEQADVFLSGNVVEKLDYAIEELQKNDTNRQLYNAVKSLERVIPSNISFEDIGISLGERWIPDGFFSEFASEHFQQPVNIRYNSIIDDFNVDGWASFQSREKYSVKSENRYYSASEVLRFAMLDNTPEMTKSVWNGENRVKVPDTEGIQKMNAAINLLQTEFKTWLTTLPSEKKQFLENIYNRRFNCYVKTQYDGGFQTFPDLDKEKLNIDDLYLSQKNAILMLKNNGGGIIDHEVGGGKTLIQCVAAYEMKRLGLANKPCILGLKANISQVAETFQKAYPFAKVLFPGKEDFSKDNRESFFNKIQNNNWDCIIMTHEQFKEIPQSLEIQRDIISEEIDKIEESIRESKNGETSSFKQIEKNLLKRKENLTAKLHSIIHNINLSKDNVVDFKTMGIDHLFVDESHKFKNLMFTTRHQRVAGLGNSIGSDRSLNLLFAIRTIQQRSGKDLGATFLSGTTISNSLTELYNIFNFLRPEALRKQSIFSFDAWASIYTLKSKDFEFNVTNDLVQKERFRQFVKVPELAMFYSQMTDYKTAEDIGIDRPKKNEIFVALDQTIQQRDMFARLKNFAKTGDGKLIYRPPLSESEERAKMLIATNTAKKAALDMRLINSSIFSDEPDNKINVVAGKIYEYYTKFNQHKGTQFVFSDIGTYKPGSEFNVYSDMKQKLVEMGIPANEIQFIQTVNTDKKRLELFKKMNAGECRVLLGSTEMLGTGVNAQERCVAIHHFDIPWTPKDLEQRNGRGVRTGNKVAKQYAGNQVDVLVYGTKETLDTYKFNLLKNKTLFISQIKNNNIGVRSIDEGGIDKDSGMSFAEYIAVLSGNTDLLQKAKLEKVVTQLKAEETVFLKQIREKELKLLNLKQGVQDKEKYLDLFKSDQKTFASFPKDNDEKCIVEYTLGTQKFTDTKLFGDALVRIMETPNLVSDYKKIGQVGGFDLVTKSEKILRDSELPLIKNKLYVQGNLKYSYNSGDVAKTPELAGKYVINSLTRIPGLIESYEAKIKEENKNIGDLESLELVFLNKEKLESSVLELKRLTEKIDQELNKTMDSVQHQEETPKNKFSR
ncbi:MAG: N-6 DNA methylase [Prolixibacteraceae bacterium]|nr:N-6 DNA methylase [Prolixibacteraceae bacterium]